MKKHIVIPIVAVVFLLAIIGVKLNEGKSSSLEQKEHIGIISAMDNEIKVLLDEADIKQVDQIGGVKYYVGSLRGKDVVITRAGPSAREMGKTAAWTARSALPRRPIRSRCITYGSIPTAWRTSLKRRA